MAQDEYKLLFLCVTAKRHLLWHSIFKQYVGENVKELFTLKQCLLYSSIEDAFLPLSGGSSRHAMACEQELGWSNCRLCTFGLLENSFFWEVVGPQINSDTCSKDYDLSASGRSREGKEERKKALRSSRQLLVLLYRAAPSDIKSSQIFVLGCLISEANCKTWLNLLW